MHLLGLPGLHAPLISWWPACCWGRTHVAASRCCSERKETQNGKKWMLNCGNFHVYRLLCVMFFPLSLDENSRSDRSTDRRHQLFLDNNFHVWSELTFFYSSSALDSQHSHWYLNYRFFVYVYLFIYWSDSNYLLKRWNFELSFLICLAPCSEPFLYFELFSFDNLALLSCLPPFLHTWTNHSPMLPCL